jgi:DNA ligase-1
MENIKETIDIFKQLQSTSSRLEKERIIKSNVENTLFKDILYFVYNPYIVTGIAEKSLNKFKNPVSTIKFEGVYEFLNYIKTHHNGSDEDLKAIVQYINTRPEYEQDFLKEIATKSLKIGATAKTINKCITSLIPQFELMLAHKYFSEIKRVMGKKFILTTKLDGIRCVIIKEYNGDITIFNRQGRPIYGLKDILHEAEALPNGFVYDGELLLKNDKKLTSKDLYRATVSIVNSDYQIRKIYNLIVLIW